MYLRKTRSEDIPVVISIIDDAIKELRKASVNQWQNGYPNAASIEIDIDKGWAYVLVQDDEILATLALSFDGDPNYDIIVDGDWLNQEPYAVIHRIAVKLSRKGEGLAGIAIEMCENICLDQGIFNIRIDTHRLNLSMQRMLQKAGYTYCGIIYLTHSDGAERLALQKVLRK